MSFMIEDGTGRCYKAAVDSNGRLQVESVSERRQHVQSFLFGRSYQITGQINVAASEESVLFLQNTSPDFSLVVTFFRFETAGVDAINANQYWSVYLGSTYSSGGSTATPINTNVGSSITPVGNFYRGSGINFSGGDLIDKSFLANEDNTYNKEGSIVLTKDKTINFTYTGSSATGVALARCSFYYKENE